MMRECPVCHEVVLEVLGSTIRQDNTGSYRGRYRFQCLGCWDREAAVRALYHAAEATASITVIWSKPCAGYIRKGGRSHDT